MYGRKSNLDEEILRKLTEKKNRSNVEPPPQAKVSINPPIKNEFDHKKVRIDRDEERDSDGRYSDDEDDRSAHKKKKSPIRSTNKHIPSSSGDAHSRHASGAKAYDPRDSRHSSVGKDGHQRPRSKSELREIELREIELRENELREIEFKWQKVETLGSIPPNDYTITNISQNYDLLVNKFLLLMSSNTFFIEKKV